jgi:hypothetical protein
MSVIITEQYNTMINSEELIGTTGYLTLYTWCRINRCRYNRVLTYLNLRFKSSAILRSVDWQRFTVVSEDVMPSSSGSSSPRTVDIA